MPAYVRISNQLIVLFLKLANRVLIPSFAYVAARLLSLLNSSTELLAKFLRLPRSSQYIFVIYSYNNYSLLTHVWQDDTFPQYLSKDSFAVFVSNAITIPGLNIAPTPLDPYAKSLHSRLNNRLCANQAHLALCIFKSILALRPIVFVVPHLRPMGFANISHLIQNIHINFVRFYDDGLSGLVPSSSTRSFMPRVHEFLIKWSYPVSCSDVLSDNKHNQTRFVSTQDPQLLVSPSNMIFHSAWLDDNSISLKKSISNGVGFVYCVLDSKYFSTDQLYKSLRFEKFPVKIFHYKHPVSFKRTSLDCKFISKFDLVQGFEAPQCIPEQHIYLMLMSGYNVKLFTAHSSTPFLLAGLINSRSPRLRGNLEIVTSFNIHENLDPQSEAGQSFKLLKTLCYS